MIHYKKNIVQILNVANLWYEERHIKPNANNWNSLDKLDGVFCVTLCVTLVPRIIFNNYHGRFSHQALKSNI